MPRMLARISDQVNSMSDGIVARRGDRDAEEIAAVGSRLDASVCRSYQLEVR